MIFSQFLETFEDCGHKAGTFTEEITSFKCGHALALHVDDSVREGDWIVAAGVQGVLIRPLARRFGEASLIRAGVFFQLLAFAGLAFLIFWVWGRDRFRHRLVQGAYPRASKMLHDLAWSMSTVLVFSMFGVAVG